MSARLVTNRETQLPGHKGKHCISNNLMTCQQTENSLKCSCKVGFNENEDGTCTDKDECSLGSHDCPISLGCVNNQGNYTCVDCFKKADNGTCLDIDECALNIHNCSTGLQCVNNDGGFDCKA